MNPLDRFLGACRPASVAAGWLEEKMIDPVVADAKGCRWCGREFSEAIGQSDRAAFGTGIDTLERWCSPSVRVAALLVPYSRFGETIGVKAIPSADVKPPALNLTPMPWPLWIDDLDQQGPVVIAWGEIVALRIRSMSGDGCVIGLPGFWKKIWAPLFSGRDVIFSVLPDGQREKIEADLLANGVKDVK